MEQKPNDRKPNASTAGYLWVLSLSVGLCIGAGVGAAIGHIGAGVAVGVGVGVVVGFVLYQRFSRHSSDD